MRSGRQRHPAESQQAVAPTDEQHGCQPGSEENGERQNEDRGIANHRTLPGSEVDAIGLVLEIPQVVVPQSSRDSKGIASEVLHAVGIEPVRAVERGVVILRRFEEREPRSSDVFIREAVEVGATNDAADE